MCTCCIWKLRVLTSLRAMAMGVGGAGGRKLWTRPTDPRRRAARARISVLRLWSDCRGARCPTVSRCLWIPNPDARAGESHSHIAPPDRKEERTGAGNGIRIVLFFFFFFSTYFSPPPLSRSLRFNPPQMKSFLGLGVPGTSRKRARYPAVPLLLRRCCLWARPLVALEYKARLYAQNHGDYMTWIYLGTKLDIYKSDVPSSFHFFPAIAFYFCVLLFCSLVWSMATLWFRALSEPSFFTLIYFFFTYYFFGPFRRRRSGMPRREHLWEEDSAQRRGWMNDSLPLHLRRAMDGKLNLYPRNRSGNSRRIK